MHDSDSAEQRSAEAEIMAALRKQLKLPMDGFRSVFPGIVLDGYQDDPVPVCVEAFAHQGASKAGQVRKLMQDMCKLLLVEKLLCKPCRKILAVCDVDSISFLGNSWRGQFAREFGIETIVVDVCDARREGIRTAQARQFR